MIQTGIGSIPRFIPLKSCAMTSSLAKIFQVTRLIQTKEKKDQINVNGVIVMVILGSNHSEVLKWCKKALNLGEKFH